MDKFLFLTVLLSVSAFTKGDRNVSVSDENDNGAKRPAKPVFKTTLPPESQNISTVRPFKPTIMSTLPPHHRPSSGSFPRGAISSSVVSVLVIFLLASLIYYCCNRNQTPEGYTQFNNENERNPLRGRSRWRNRRFFRRKRCPTQIQNSPEAGNSTHVTVQPVLTVNISTGDNSSATPAGDDKIVPSMLLAPPAYDESINNPPIPSQFIDPSTTNQFVNPTFPSQYMNPPMPSQFMNISIPSNFNNLPTSSNLNNSSVRARL